MIRLFSHHFRRRTLLHVLLDVCLIVVCSVAVVVARVDRPDGVIPLAATGGLSLAACLLLINSASGFYQHSHKRSLNQSCTRAAVVLLLAVPLTYGIFGLMPPALANLDALRTAAMLSVAAVLAHRVYAAHSAARAAQRTRVLIYGSGAAADMVGRSIEDHDPRASVVGYFRGPNEDQSIIPANKVLPAGSSLSAVATNLGVDEIVVAVAERRGGSLPLRELLDCKLAGIRVFDVATYFEKTLGQIRVDYVHAGWLIFGEGFSQGAFRTVAKRTFDLVGSLLLLALAAPLMLLTVVFIKLDSQGPVLYRQTRVGLDGKPFDVIKFRSMRADAERDGKPQWAALRDDRVTRVGHVMRKFRIDELPQLFNVLKGEMSLVGPRPERPFFVDQLTLQIPYYATRHSVKPGVTGWAQVRYHYGSTVEDSQQKLQFDLYYVKNHTLFLDMIVLFETVAVVLMGKGAR